MDSSAAPGPAPSTSELREESAGLRLVHQTEVKQEYLAVKKTIVKIVKSMAQQINSQAYCKDKLLNKTLTLIELCSQLTKNDLMKMVKLEDSFAVPQINEQLRKKLQ